MQNWTGVGSAVEVMPTTVDGSPSFSIYVGGFQGIVEAGTDADGDYDRADDFLLFKLDANGTLRNYLKTVISGTTS